MLKYDCHIHSVNSVDSDQTLDMICSTAIKKGISGVTVTDHADMWYYAETDTLSRIKSSISDTCKAAEKYGDRLSVFCGIELSEYDYDPQKSAELLELTEYDAVLGSVHCVEFEGFHDAYSKMPFGPDFKDEEIYAFLEEYLLYINRMVDKFDLDIAAHLTCPLRYINGKYGRNADIMKFTDEITEILRKIIKRDMALEVNTSGMKGQNGYLMPDERILSLYRSLGGEKITLGSDAHITQNIGNSFKRVVEILKRIGFNGYYYYKKRKGIKINF